MGLGSAIVIHASRTELDVHCEFENGPHAEDPFELAVTTYTPFMFESPTVIEHPPGYVLVVIDPLGHCAK